MSSVIISALHFPWNSIDACVDELRRRQLACGAKADASQSRTAVSDK